MNSFLPDQWVKLEDEMTRLITQVSTLMNKKKVINSKLSKQESIGWRITDVSHLHGTEVQEKNQNCEESCEIQHLANARMTELEWNDHKMTMKDGTDFIDRIKQKCSNYGLTLNEIVCEWNNMSNSESHFSIESNLQTRNIISSFRDAKFDMRLKRKRKFCTVM